MRRLILLLALLAAAVPAAAGAQDPAATAPVATTGAAEAVTATGATLNGSVDRNGAPTTYRFEYGPTTAYGQSTPEATLAADGSDPVAVEAAVAGLTPGTTYHYRLVATNLAGTSTGADRTFRTAAAPRAPGVTSTGSREVTSRSARLHTTVDPNGQDTTVRFEYGRTASYGSFTDRIPAGAGDRGVPLSLELRDLRPNTRYHFRAVATNATGSTRSLNRSFRTPREPTGVSIAVTPSRVIWGGGVTVIGRVSGTAVSGTRVALERQEFPFRSSFTQVGDTRRATRSGAFRFILPSLFVTTHFRVVTRTRAPVASSIRTASSALKVGRRTRSRGRRRVRIEGSIWPAVPAGRASLQKRSPRGRWAVVRRARTRPFDADRSRYRFTVRRGKRLGRYRIVVLARDGGAHVPGRSREVRVRALRKRR